MQFYDAIITNEGVRMLTAATFANKLTFTRLLFCADDVALGVTTQSLEHSWGNGHIDNYATADDGSFVIYGSASNAQDYGMAYGFAVYGYLNSEGPENERIVFVANADGVPTYVNSQSGAATRFQFAIKAKINLSDQVIRIDPSYNGLVSNIAFQDLLERTVTTHSATDNAVGDAQVVRGQKHFYDTAYFGGDSNAPYIEVAVDRENGSMYLNAEHESQQIRVQMKPKDYGDDSNNNVYVNTNISPSGDGVVSLGSNEHKWFETNAYYVWATERVGVSKAEYGTTNIGAGSIEFVNANDDSIGTIGIENDTRFRIDGNPVYITKLTVDGNLNVTGSFNAATLNAASATIGNISTTSISTQEVDATGIQTTALNAASATIGNISTTTLTTQEVDATAAEINALNAASATIGGIAYQSGFAHPFPAYGNLDHMPVGSIFLAYITNNSRIIYPGEYLTATDTMAIVSLGIDISGGSPAPVLLNTSEVALVNIGAAPREQYQVLNVVPSAGGIALVMRIR